MIDRPRLRTEVLQHVSFRLDFVPGLRLLDRDRAQRLGAHDLADELAALHSLIDVLLSRQVVGLDQRRIARMLEAICTVPRLVGRHGENASRKPE